MDMLEFTHEAKPAQNRRLFGLIGEFCADAALRRQTGGSIDSRPGVRWFVLTDNAHRNVAAFGSVWLSGVGVARLHLFCGRKRCEAHEKTVLARCLDYARAKGAKTAVLTDFARRAEFYGSLNFQAKRERGRFTTYEVTL